MSGQLELGAAAAHGTCTYCGQVLPSRRDPHADRAGQGPKRRRTDRAAARAAAAANEPRRGSQRARLLVALVDAGADGATADELAGRTGVPYVSCSTRLTELRRGGWALSTSAVRETRSGGR